MIELVFTIVIMGIAVMSLPLLLIQVQRNDSFSMQQEAILATKSRMGDILTYEWDNNSYNANDQRSYVLDTLSDPELTRVTGTTHRVGYVNAESRRKLFDVTTNPTAVTALGNDGVWNDIDDFSGQPPSTIKLLFESASNLDYVFDLNLTTTVTYAADTANYSASTLGTFVLNPDNNASITNIKTISVTVAGSDQNITLRSFSCNIGEAIPLPSRPYK
jgi:hypothetical protein